MKRGRQCADEATLRAKAKMARLETLRLTDICGSGHYGSAFSIAEILAALYYDFLHVRPGEPQWRDRDRFTMGKGHAAIALYPILADLGFFAKDALDNYTRLGSPLGDHPDMRKVAGADFSSGSIGHNLSVSVGMALGLRLRESPARVVNLMGDGEQTEGQIWEAAIAAGFWRLDGLVGIVDINKVGSDGKTQKVMDTQPLADKWRACKWRVLECDGHDLPVLCDTLNKALNEPDGRPTVVLADTVAGKGVSFMEGTWQWHLGYLGPADLRRARAELAAD